MEGSVGAQIFWMITIGLLIGYVSYFIFGKRGVSLTASIVMALSGALVTGGAALILGFNMALSYSFIGALAFIFLTNVFKQDEHGASMDTGDRSSGSRER